MSRERVEEGLVQWGYLGCELADNSQLENGLDLSQTWFSSTVEGLSEEKEDVARLRTIENWSKKGKDVEAEKVAWLGLKKREG